MDLDKIRFSSAVDIIKSHWESVMLAIVIARSFDRFSNSIEYYARSIRDQPIKSTRMVHKYFRIFLYGLLFVVISASVSPVLVLYWAYPCDLLKFGTALFFLLVDIDAFVIRVQYFLKSSHLPSQDYLRSSFWVRMFSKSPFQLEESINLLIKILILGIGAASGYIYLESLCIIILLEQVVYVLLLVIFVPLPIYAFYAFNHLLQPGETEINYLQQPVRRILQGVSRVRSKSFCVEESAYPERRHVDVAPQAVIDQQKSINTAESPIQKRIKYLTLTGFFVLYLHNRYILGKYEHINDSSSKTLGSSTAGSLLNDIPYSIHWVLSSAFERTNLNLVCFLLVGFLLYYRAKIRASQKTEMFNLDVKPLYVEGDPLPQRTTSCNRLSHKNENGGVFTAVNIPKNAMAQQLTSSDSELLQLLSTGELKTRDLESMVSNPIKAVELRRLDLARLLSNPHALERLPYQDYDYRYVHGQCCEEVIGYVPIPVGKVGPLLLDGHSHYIPLATTEGCLVASTNRGCRALFLAGGVSSVLFRDQMTRAPVVWFSSVLQVVQCIAWIESAEGFGTLKAAFEQTSSHIQLLSIFPNPCGHYLHIRFSARTGDAMGMNMVSKATNHALKELHRHFPAMQVISLSGNMCTDKKPAAINSILGRGKSVIAEAHLPATVLAQVLHTTATRLARLAHAKNWTGSAMAGCPGMLGSNAHAANIVAGIFAATGQDLAQVVDASSCLTQFEVGENDSLVATVTMPCMEVGTIGGGTRLPAQRSCLELLDLNVDRPTEHLARLIAGAVLAGELSLMAALDTDDLVTAHLRFNRAVVKPAVGEPTQPSVAVSSVSKSTENSFRVNGPTISVTVTSDLSSDEECSHPTM